MPARDPAAAPHVLATSPHDTRMVLPTHVHGRTRASSSAFSRTVSDHHLHGGTPGTSGIASARQVSTPDGIVSKLLRRVSASSGAHDFEAGAAPGPDDAASEVSSHAGDHDDSHVLGSSHTEQAIRESTNRLASMSFTGTSRVGPPPPGASGFFDHRHSSSRRGSHGAPVDLGMTPRTVPESPPTGPSALSVLMERGRKAANSDSGDSGETTPHAAARSLEDPSPVQTAAPSGSGSGISRLDRRASNGSHAATHGSHVLEGVAEVEEDEEMGGSSELRQYLTRESRGATERTPLLGDSKSSWKSRTAVDLAAARNSLSKLTPGDLLRMCVMEPIHALPAVILGLLLNVLDGVSYGMILFPASPFYPDYGSLGVSMFFVSCIAAQLVFSLGGSIFKAGNGSMMIEAVPFFHIICATIQSQIGDDADAIVATTMVSFAFSSILTGLVFFALGAFRLGALIGYFPRHILVGCIGGVGIFLIVTGLEVSLGLNEEGVEYNWATLKLFFESPHAVILWTLPLALAILLRVITHFYHHQLIFPIYFFIIPAIFYIVVAIGGWDFDTLREAHWVFDVGKNVKPWWTFYTGFKFSHVSWGTFWDCMPTQLALVFFGILHVPLNVPALGVSLSEDNVKLDRELVAHGISNVGAGLVGTVPNYLTYVNSVMFYRVGGDTRLAGVMLAIGTAIIMMVGPTVIGYLPVMVVGALIYVLGIDLVIEAVWDTRHRVNRMEYITIWVIAIGMTVFDFVIGLLVGIILACVFFVVQSSRRRSIRAVFSGSTAKSTVRRPHAQRAFLQRVGFQTYVMKLQGFLFFGTIGVVEDEIRALLDMAEWEHNPIRFLIIDFALVAGLDFSSAEAFVRIQRLLAAKDVLLVLCGADPHGLVGTALRAVDLWADQEGTRVEVFESLNNALEWTENAYLTAFYENQQRTTDEPVRSIDLPKIHRMPFSLAESFQNSPRRTQLAKAGDDTLPLTYGPGVPRPKAPLPSPLSPTNTRDSSPATNGSRDTSPNAPGSKSYAAAAQSASRSSSTSQPLQILLQTIGTYTDSGPSFFTQFTPYFSPHPVSAGTTLWRQGDAADGMYLIESGSLRATYAYNNSADLCETMVAGTVAGDMSALSETPRNATVVAERDCVLWKLSTAGLRDMQRDKPEAAGQFIKIVLRAAVEEQDVLASHLIAVLS